MREQQVRRAVLGRGEREEDLERRRPRELALLPHLAQRADAGAASFRRKGTLEEHLEAARKQVEALRKELEEDPARRDRVEQAARERAASIRLALGRAQKAESEAAWDDCVREAAGALSDAFRGIDLDIEHRVLAYRAFDRFAFGDLAAWAAPRAAPWWSAPRTRA